MTVLPTKRTFSPLTLTNGELTFLSDYHPAIHALVVNIMEYENQVNLLRPECRETRVSWVPMVSSVINDLSTDGNDAGQAERKVADLRESYAALVRSCRALKGQEDINPVIYRFLDNAADPELRTRLLDKNNRLAALSLLRCLAFCGAIVRQAFITTRAAVTIFYRPAEDELVVAAICFAPPYTTYRATGSVVQLLFNAGFATRAELSYRLRESIDHYEPEHIATIADVLYILYEVNTHAPYPLIWLPPVTKVS
jgi:hypothetical protein